MASGFPDADRPAAARRVHPPRRSDLAPALGLVAIGMTALVAMTLAPPRFRGPVAESQMAVLFAPWLPVDLVWAKVVAAGGLAVRAGGPGLLVVQPLDQDFGRRIFDQGAWLALNPGFLGGCSTVKSGRAK